MLTLPTAKSVGVTDRLDPEQSVKGGVEYLRRMVARIPDSIEEHEKIWFALASYNVGYGHVMDARRLTKRQGGNPDAFDAHQLKRIIDRNVSFGKTKTGLSGESERALKDFRRGLNESLQVASPEYRRANQVYSETLEALDSLQKAAGSSVDMTGDYATEALGNSLRRLLGYTQARANMMGAIDQADEIGRKTGAKFDDDITSQMLFADELDSLFGTTARTSLKGQQQQVADKAARDAQAVMMATQGAPDTGAISNIVGRGVRAAKGINEENAIKAIEEMLK